MIHTLVRDWMTQDPITVRPETKIIEAYQLMVTTRIRRLPIIVRNLPVGIVTLSDLYQVKPFDIVSEEEQTLCQTLEQMKVEEVMSPDPITITEDATIGKAAQTMLEHKISGLPVVAPKAGNLLGIITESDIFRIVAQEWSTRHHGSLPLPRRSA
ncbi:CBS domain-containing protein [Candidatus Poribacteria bacterium]|nr:CBS domain-containing protein [Candidatus Poribacteria bacterium]MYH80201.1 CBS domain-containing protein [Candidatus Poribacteria bacterium]MYK93719.1 CBS domain-containing protein [Candidatus Poribacteria bacterium]